MLIEIFNQKFDTDPEVALWSFICVQPFLDDYNKNNILQNIAL